MRSVVIALAALAAGACAQEPGGGGQGTWEPVTTTGAPAPRAGHVAVWNGQEMIVWGGTDDLGRLDDGGRYDPALDSWTPMSTAGAPPGRAGHRAVVTTDGRMLVWGGIADDPPSSGVAVAEGAIYDPDTDTWTPMSTAGVPEARLAHLAVWTGSEMIVWGGSNLTDAPFATGGRYDPATDQWRAMSTAGAPPWEVGFTAVWTGSEMIAWGMSGPSQSIPIGARYSPSTDTWRTMGEEGAPAIVSHIALWTGGEMIVWGSSVEGIGARYNPVSDLWSVTTRFPEAGGVVEQRGVWTDRELIVWGGLRPGSSDSVAVGTGTRYEPSFLAANPVATAGAPSARFHHTAVWTGSEMIVWGGRVFREEGGTSTIDTGARYTPP